MNGEMKYDKVLDINAADKHPTPGHYEIMQMLISIYFPHLLGRFQTILKSREAVSDMQRNFKQAYEMNVPTRQFSQPFDKALLEFEALCNDLKKQICHLGQQRH
jgi:hypothetical protein